VHPSLVCVTNISYQSKKLRVNEKHFSRRFNPRCGFFNFSWYFFDISKPFFRHNKAIQWYFFHQCICMLVLNHFTVKFFCLSRFKNWISPPNVFWGKVQNLFSTLKHYNLAIYVVKWLQIWFTSSTIYTLQDCPIEILIPYWHFEL